MKIAMIGHKRIPSREGGIEIVVEKLARCMVSKGHDVVAYNRRMKGKEKIKEYEGIKIIQVPTFEKKSLNAIVYSFLAAIKATFSKYDVIHFHAEGPCVALIIPHIFRKKTVVTIHGLDWQRAKWGGFATKVILLGEKFAAKYADEIIVLSKNVQKYFKETYNKDVIYLPNGVVEHEYIKAEIIKEKYGLDRNGYVLFLARLVPEKGLHYLINAYKQIDTEKKLVIAGGSSHTDEYVEKIRNMVKDDDRIIMTGFVTGNELRELYSNALLYVLPSDVEGMPISLLEALSYGCKCLVSDIDENVEVTGSFAYTFKKGDVDDLKRVLEEALYKGELETRERVFPEELKQRFDWNYITDEHINIYHSVAKKDCTEIVQKI